MSLADKVAEAMKSAMRSKDKSRLEALRSIKSALLLAQSEKGGRDAAMSEADELKLLQKLQKQRKDSLAIYEEQNREELARDEREQLAVIEEFLPAAMSDEELRKALAEIVERTGASGPQDMGKVMGAANAELAGRADGKRISTEARKLLQS